MYLHIKVRYVAEMICAFHLAFHMSPSQTSSPSCSLFVLQRSRWGARKHPIHAKNNRGAQIDRNNFQYTLSVVLLFHLFIGGSLNRIGKKETPSTMPRIDGIFQLKGSPSTGESRSLCICLCCMAHDPCHS